MLSLKLWIMRFEHEADRKGEYISIGNVLEDTSDVWKRKCGRWIHKGETRLVLSVKGNRRIGNIGGENSHFQAPTMVETGFYDCPGPVSCQ